MTKEEFIAMFDDEGSPTGWEGDNAYQGLEIIRKYIPKKTVICGADHDIIYSVDVDDLIEAGITKEDAEKLRNLNWMVEEECDCMACFV